MAVTVKLPTQLRAAVGGESALSGEGATVGEVLDSVYAAHGELRERISDGDGGLRRFVNVYVGNDDVRFLDNLETPTPDGAQISVIPAVAGG